jgi:hypothetical protein
VQATQEPKIGGATKSIQKAWRDKESDITSRYEEDSMQIGHGGRQDILVSAGQAVREKQQAAAASSSNQVDIVCHSLMKDSLTRSALNESDFNAGTMIWSGSQALCDS